MSGLISPDTGNLVIGKGVGLFKRDGDADFFCLGNLPKVTYTPSVTNLPHFTAMAGIKLEDFSEITQLGGSLAADMEEQTANNLSMYFMGDIDITDPTIPKIGLYTALAPIEGYFKFIATNRSGPRWYMDLTRVRITPQGNFSPIGDTYNTTQVTMQHLADEFQLFGSISLHPPVKDIVPENVLLPFIDGVAQVGHELTVKIGAWVGSQQYAFQWKVGTTLGSLANVAGQTTSKYTPVSGDIGKLVVCSVTSTNGNGSTTVASTPTVAVIA